MPRKIRPELVGVVLLALLAVVSLTRRDLFIGDETKYSQVVREMHRDGAVLLPTLNGEPYTHKPPLHFWLMYVLTGVGGQRAMWPYVLPALLSFAALVWLTGRVAVDWLGSDAAWPSRFFFAGLALVWGLAQTARMDLMFACLTTAGVTAFFRYLESRTVVDGLRAGVWFGIAGLVKGPMAILILVALFVVESLASRRRPRSVDVVMFGSAVLVPLAWFVPAVLSAGLPYLEEIIVRQTAGRVVGSWVHREPPWYYLVGAPLIVFPFFFVLVSAIRSAREADAEQGAMLGRCIRWILAIVVPFSLVSSKLPVYMVPAFPAVALLAAWYVGLSDTRMKWTAFAVWGNRVVFAFLALTPVLVLSGVVQVEGDVSSLFKLSGVRAGLLAMSAISLAGLVAGWGSIRYGSLILPFAIAAPLAVMFAVDAPAINDYASSRLLAKEIKRQYETGDSIGMYYTPHLWSRTLPEELEGARQVTLDELASGLRPDILAVRADRVDRLGEWIGDYREVSSVRMMGKSFNVFRRR